MAYIYAGFIKAAVMKISDVIEKFGGLIKMEPLMCLEDDSLMGNACLLESTAPFKGYYDDAPEGNKPLYLFIVLDGEYTIDGILRATLNVKKKAGFLFDAAFGTVRLFDQTCPVIRIRDLENFRDINKLQVLYLAEGLKFKKKTKSFDSEEAIITQHKLFYLEDLGDGMYLDRSQPHHGYFIIPQCLEFSEVIRLTREVKYDTSLLLFDAALAWYYQGEGMVHMIRIYRENLTKERLKAIRDRYLSLIK